jgi:methylated-DNA-protein-cysteine methyltransferase-like protein
MDKPNIATDVIELVKLIPSGRVTSYGAIAMYLGAKRSSRVVGWILNQCAKNEVPAHRVVNRNGLLTGKHHFPGLGEMQRRLEAEGVKVENDQVIDFEKLFWDPSKELII